MSADTRPVAERFMAALQAFEAGGPVDALADLFTDDADLANLAHAMHGRDGARRFWDEYRGVFGTIRSTFAAVIVGDGAAALEWTSTGTMPDGSPIEYRGVSLLDIDGDRVRRFRTYYDSAAFSPAAAGRGT